VYTIKITDGNGSTACTIRNVTGLKTPHENSLSRGIG
jgi:hypothetical protein